MEGEDKGYWRLSGKGESVHSVMYKGLKGAGNRTKKEVGGQL
jgi:hypothetical protein